MQDRQEETEDDVQYSQGPLHATHSSKCVSL